MRNGGRPNPSPEEVREIVRRVVDATLAAEAAGRVSSPAGATLPTFEFAPEASVGAQPLPTASEPIAIAIGADHGGVAMKAAIARMLTEAGFAVRDCGTSGSDPVDYPDIAHDVARLVASGTCRWGIILDGAGIGSCMVANKVPGIRAALCHDLSSARNSREHNHANVLTLGARFIGEGLAIEIVRVWLETPWGPGRHAARVDKITAVERRYAAGEVRG